MSVRNISPTASFTPLSLILNSLYCFTRLTRSPPACMVPSTSGLGDRPGALSRNVEKLSFGNGVGSLATIVPPALPTACGELLSGNGRVGGLLTRIKGIGGISRKLASIWICSRCSVNWLRSIASSFALRRDPKTTTSWLAARAMPTSG